MASNILFLPFRRTHSVQLSEAIKQYISTKYDQHPDMFTQDLEDIDRLRKEAVHAQEPHASGIRKLQAYAAQLTWLSGKFPIDIGVDFTWYPALGYNTSRPTSQNNIRFELANILYNLAAMYSQLAIASNRSTAEGLKAACNHFCLAAGTISYLKSTVVPEMRSTPPEDMDTMTLESIEHLMLAQAQETFWQKAVKDGLKDASIAKLAAKVSDFYSQSGDFGIKSDAISSEWIHHMTAKHHHFAAAAQYRAACDCLEKRKYGEEVARLKDSLNCVSEALKEARYINKVVLGDLNGLKTRVQEDLKRAEKDNDMIYLIPVPPKSELKTLDRASMVSSKVPKELSDAIGMLGDHSELGKPLFTKLVPYSVHLAASIYADRRDRLITTDIIEELEHLTAKIHETLASLNLPGALQALEKPLGLPPGLLAHAEEIRAVDGINRLRRTMEETRTLKDSDKAIYQEGVDALRSEVAEDERARRKYGTDRWNRPTSEAAVPKLWPQIAEIEGYLKAAENSDTLVRNKLKENEYHITLLGATDRDLEQFVPSSRRVSLSPAIEKETSRLRGCLNELSRIESRRRRRIDAVKVKAKHDDINPELLKEAARLEREYPMQNIEAVQFEPLFEERLKLYDSDLSGVQVEDREQQEIFKRLQEAHISFSAAKKGEGASKQREQALQALENAFFKYKEIVSNLETGRKFYNDLARIVTRFRDDCRNHAYARRAEAQQIEADITTGMAGLSIQQPAQQQQAPQQQASAQQSLQYQQNPPFLQQRPVLSSPVPQQQASSAPTGEPLAAPTPTRATGPPTAGMWTPDMGIKFGGPPTSNNTSGTQGGGQAGGNRPVDGRWNPASGINFG